MITVTFESMHVCMHLESPDSGELKIIRMNKYYGSVSGHEEIYLLCEKVNKKEIKVRFFELDDDGKFVWESYGKFSESDVHHQVAIVFLTPPYYNVNIVHPVRVYLQLYRPRDGECSPHRTFIYNPLNTQCMNIHESILNDIKLESMTKCKRNKLLQQQQQQLKTDRNQYKIKIKQENLDDSYGGTLSTISTSAMPKSTATRRSKLQHKLDRIKLELENNPTIGQQHGQTSQQFLEKFHIVDSDHPVDSHYFVDHDHPMAMGGECSVYSIRFDHRRRRCLNCNRPVGVSRGRRLECMFTRSLRACKSGQVVNDQAVFTQD